MPPQNGAKGETLEILINILIYSGSALMVYNIVRYGMFVNRSAGLERKNRKGGLIIIPLLLLIFFLVGYIGVGISGIADILIASILFGGSVFVFLLLAVMFSIINRIRETDRVLSSRYEEMSAQLSVMTEDALSALMVNLTADKISERSGEHLFESDYDHDTYSELLAARDAYVVDPNYRGAENSVLRREELLRLYQEGQTGVSEILLVRRSGGEAKFVRFEAKLTKLPVSGDVAAMIVERAYNDQIVRETLLGRVMMDQYDRIAYLIDGAYHELSSNEGKKEGLLFHSRSENSYESLYLNYILPSMVWDKRSGTNPLRLSVIDKALEDAEVYRVNEAFVIDGQLKHKRLDFYRVDRSAKFYVMLVSDTTHPATADTEESASLKNGAAEEGEAPPAADGVLPAAEEAKTEITAGTEPQNGAPEGKQLHILLVDDNEINREIAGMMLSSDGWTVQTATNGAEAVEAVSAAEPGTFDLVLMDVQMPVMNGYEATAAIRALPDPEKRSVPIIAVTANAFEEDVAAAKAAGMNGHVTKPVESEAIKKVIAEVTRK